MDKALFKKMAQEVRQGMSLKDVCKKYKQTLAVFRYLYEGYMLGLAEAKNDEFVRDLVAEIEDYRARNEKIKDFILSK